LIRQRRNADTTEASAVLTQKIQQLNQTFCYPVISSTENEVYEGQIKKNFGRREAPAFCVPHFQIASGASGYK